MVDQLELLIESQIAFNVNFNIQIISSFNASLLSPLQSDIFAELRKKVDWPVKHFAPNDFKSLRNEIHVVLLSPSAFDAFLKWVS